MIAGHDLQRCSFKVLLFEQTMTAVLANFAYFDSFLKLSVGQTFVAINILFIFQGSVGALGQTGSNGDKGAQVHGVT